MALQTRRMASAIASQAAGVVASAGTEKTANPMPIVFVSAEVRSIGLSSVPEGR